jgi:hypothetical protein
MSGFVTPVRLVARSEAALAAQRLALAMLVALAGPLRSRWAGLIIADGGLTLS